MKKNTFNTIGIIGKPAGQPIKEPSIPTVARLDSAVIPALRALADLLLDMNITIVTEQHVMEQMQHTRSDNSQMVQSDRAEMAKLCDVIIVIGGDGTLLDAARTLDGADVPLIGINLGRLGFLVDISPEDIIKHLPAMLAGEYISEQRFLLETLLYRDDTVTFSHKAFNDVVLHSGDVLRMIEFETYANEKFISRHRADGMIVTGPTGSTAYALSGGGPVLHPSLDALMLVPICPHTLTDRPLVLNADNSIEIILDETNQVPAVVSCDGQLNFALQNGDRLKVNRTPDNVTLLHPNDYDYFSILRDKLGWGRDRYVSPGH